MDNLIPWSIVAFDSKERTPKERIEMVKRLGYSQYAFGGRMKHIKTMDSELRLAKQNGIKIAAVWLYMNPTKDKPGKLKEQSELVFEALKKENLKTQIWVGFHPEYFTGLTDDESLEKGEKIIAYLCKRAKEVDCKIALYNHGGWLGNPVNQLKVIELLPQYDIGVIFNFHHSHEHLAAYSKTIKAIFPYLWSVSLNGMKKEGPKIITIGEGNLEKEMIQELLDLGYKGPFGILGHVKGGDTAIILKKNLQELHKLFPQ